MFINFSQKKLIKEYVSLCFKSKKLFNLLKENDEKEIQINEDFLKFNRRLIYKINTESSDTIQSNMKSNLSSSLLVGMILYKIATSLGISIGDLNKSGLNFKQVSEFMSFMTESCQTDGTRQNWWRSFENFLSQRDFNIKKILDANELKTDYDWNTAIYFSDRINENGYYNPDVIKRSKTDDDSDIITMYQGIIGGQYSKNTSWYKDTGLKYAVVKKKSSRELKVIFNLGLQLPRQINLKIEDGFENIITGNNLRLLRTQEYFNVIQNVLMATDQPDWYDTITGDEGNTTEVIDTVVDIYQLGGKKILVNILGLSVEESFEKTIEKAAKKSIEDIIKNYITTVNLKKNNLKNIPKNSVFKLKKDFIEKCLKTADELGYKDFNLETLKKKAENLSIQEFDEFKKICDKLKKEETLEKNQNIVAEGLNKQLLLEFVWLVVPVFTAVGNYLFEDVMQLSDVNYFEKHGYYEIDITDIYGGDKIQAFYNSLDDI
jgi:hypothetical protein